MDFMSWPSEVMGMSFHYDIAFVKWFFSTFGVFCFIWSAQSILLYKVQKCLMNL